MRNLNIFHSIFRRINYSISISTEIMELRNLSKNNTIKPNTKKIIPKSTKDIKKISIESEKENLPFPHENHHAAKYLRGT
jgi:hypothetical protein